MSVGRNILRIVGALLLVTLFLLGPGTKPTTAQSLDKYGGYTALPVAGGATGYFRTGKLSNGRWVLVSPLGNAVWLRGVFLVGGDSHLTEQGVSYNSVTTAKYGETLGPVWKLQTSRRLKAWGFNALGEYSHDGMISLGDADRFPHSIIANGSYYSFTNAGSYGPHPVKDLFEVIQSSAYTGYTGGSHPDIYDSGWVTYVTKRTAAGVGYSDLGTAWDMGLSVDDLDYLFGYGSGRDFPADAYAPNVAWIALALQPTFARSARHGVTYTDTTVYAKIAVRDFLRTRYTTVAALNAAWGASYTSWGSDGGYGTGTGVLDEDGRHTGYLGNLDGTLLSANTTVITDLNDFLLAHARRYFSTYRTACKAAFPNQLVWGPATMNNHGGITRQQVLQAAGEYMDVIQAGSTSQAIYNQTVAWAGDVPLVSWEGYPANPDSSRFRYANPYDTLSLQADRGSQYRARMTTLLSWPNYLGFKWWAWTDSFAEQSNFGLVSLRDNAYDGKEAVIAAGVDSWGYRTGGEERNYGDFISSVKAANASVATALGAGTGGGSPGALTVAVTAPQGGSTVSQSVTVSALASSAATRLNLMLDGSIMAMVSGATASYPWDTTSSPNGTHTWTARAYDSSGNSVNSAPSSVTVQNSNGGGGDTTPPVVAITQLVNGGTVARKGTVSMTATASDNVGVTRVDFYLNGSLKCSDTTAPYACVWQVPAAPGKTFTIQAKAYDAAGNVGSSSIVTVTAR